MINYVNLTRYVIFLTPIKSYLYILFQKKEEALLRVGIA